jgi:hypothetical protein
MRVPGAAVAAAVAAALVTTIAFASPQDEKKKKDNERVMVVKGCVNRSRLDVTQVDATGSYVDHFNMRGNKDLMKVLTKDLDRHLVEVTGTVYDPHKKQGLGKTIQVGSKTTITVGARDTPGLPGPGTDATLNVESFKDLAPHCSGGH